MTPIEMIVRTLILILLLGLIDLYVFQGVKTISRNFTPTTQRNIQIAFWLLNAVCCTILIAGVTISDYHSWNKVFRTYAFAFILIFYFSKVFFIAFLLIDDISRVFQFVYTKLKGNDSLSNDYNTSGYISRHDFIVKTGLVIAAIPFISMVAGMVKGAYNYTIHRVKIKHAGIPKEFNGFKIVQISDIHSGSFTFEHKVDRAVEMILNQKPDLVLFTGDLVNEMASEVLPFIETFKKITAPHGVFSILGNHDYGDYHQWPSAEDKQQNFDNLIQSHADIGWKLMMDEHQYIEKGDSKIGLLGVQNWSSHKRFPRHGDLIKATNNFEPQSFNLLMSHDPSHWHGEVLDKYPFIHLTLSGHTHGMQFGIEIPGIKWSPVQYVYRQWAGLYSKENQHLYVNRGLGFIGYPGRVGIMPEITVFELVATS
ncbi:MAG: metallophosphoesterase [Bacteroidetes bacterium]|nr:metallophosphoesterase [Bacteroidota bacterium]